MYLSMKQASKEARVAKTTLLDAVKTGRLSAQKNDRGHWQIDPAELFRVFPKQAESPTLEQQPTLLPEQQKTPENNAQQAVIETLREQLAQANEQNARLTDLLDRSSAEFRQALLALTQQPTERRGFFSRLFS